MPRPNRGTRLSDKPNEHGFYEIVWVEPGANGKKARTKRLSTGEKDVEQATRILAHYILGKKEQEAETDEERIRSGRIYLAPLVRDYWVEKVKRKNVGHNTTYYNIKNLVRFFCDVDTTEWCAPDADKRIAVLKDWLAGKMVAALDDEMIERYVEARRAGEIGEEATNGGIRRELAVLSAIINHAAGKKRVSRDCVLKIAMPDEPDPKERWLKDPETEALLRVCQPARAKRLTRVYRFAAVARYLASRRAAIETLRWDQIDMDQWILFLNPRGRRQTTKRRPTLPIPPILQPVFVRAWRERENDEWFLDHPGSVRKTFDSAVELAGLAPPRPWLAEGREPTDAEWDTYRHAAVTPHTLRHTWATRAAQNGVALWKIAGVLGDSMETVTKRYLHHCPDHLRDAVELGVVAKPVEDIDL